MKKILSQYPTVLYQIILLFIVEKICFSIVITTIEQNLYAPLDELESYSTDSYNWIIISLLYILAGYITEKIKDVRRVLFISSFLISLSYIIINLGIDSINTIYFAHYLLQFGHALFYILCLIHISIFFPVANDWKDNALTFFLLVPILVVFIFFNFGVEFLFYLMDLTNWYSVYRILGFAFLGLLFFFLSKFKDIGYRLEDSDEENEKEEEKDTTEENKTTVILIGLVFFNLVFSFISENLINLNIVTEYIYFTLDDLIDVFGIGRVYVNIFTYTILLIASLYYMKKASFHSNHITKFRWVSISLLILAVLKLIAVSIGGYTFDYFIETIINSTYSIILLPLFISMLTHVHLEKNIGLWISLLIAIPSFWNGISFYILSGFVTEYFPYLAIAFIILFLIFLKENQVFLETKLALNEPNQIEEDDEGIDIMEHFIEK